MRYTITLQHKSAESKHWAKKYCKSYVSCTLHGNFSDGRGNLANLFMDYYFNDDKDAMWFTLRWM
jgi:hypothetical protein